MKKIVRSLLVLGCLVSTTALGSQFAFADEAGPATDHFQGECQKHGQHNRRHEFGRMMKELKLTDQQKAQAKALFKANRPAMKPLFVNLVTAKHQLRTLIESGSADQAAIQAQSTAVATAEANLAVQKAQNTKQFLALLTPDQLTTYKAIQAKREARFQKFLSKVNAAPAAQ